MKDIVLELTKVDETSQETFYRYRLDDTVFWFSQKDNGNIYMVYVAPPKGLGIELYVYSVNCYYPDTFILSFPSMQLESHIDYMKFMRKLQKAEKTLTIIRRFFEESDHAKLYKDNNAAH